MRFPLIRIDNRDNANRRMEPCARLYSPVSSRAKSDDSAGGVDARVDVGVGRIERPRAHHVAPLNYKFQETVA